MEKKTLCWCQIVLPKWRTFVYYIAEAKYQILVGKITSAKFYSLLLDSSTDTGNIDNEVLLVVWCDLDGHDEKVYMY